MDPWEDSKYRNYIRQGLRKLWLRSPVRRTAKMESRREYEGENKRQKFEYQCDICKNWFKDKETQVDHIEPCGSLLSFKDLPSFVSRLFCGAEGLRVLCKPCHKQVTKEQRKKK